MSRPDSIAAYDQAIEAIQRFLAAPVEGVPAELLDAFRQLAAKGMLPPGLFLEAVEQAPVAISITDPAARILYVNALFEQLTGYGREEVTGKNESVLSSRSTPVSVYQDLWECIQDRRVWKGALVNHRKDGSEYLAELVIAPVLNPQGAIEYYLGMHRDVTELHQLEQRLKFQKGLTEAALDAAPLVVAMLNADRRVLLDNHAYKALLGDFRGLEPAHLFLDALEREFGFDLGQVCQAGNGFSNIEVRLDPPGGAPPRWFACSGVRVAELDEAAQNYFKQSQLSRCCLLLVANEVTASRNRINEARLNLIRSAMAEQQMAQTLRESISGAIFKLQGPLNVIKAALAMPGLDPCADRCALRKVLQGALDTGYEAVENLRAALPSPAREQASSLNINEILHDVLRLSTQSLLASGILVDWRPAPVLPALTGQANALRGLFKSLIDNAIQALNESNRSQREIHLDTRLDGRELVVEVTDNGPGVPARDRLRLFEPFFCGWTRPGGHAGMGLTMAQEVVIEHQGSLEIDPDFTGGCRLFVRLPLQGMGGD